MRPMWFALAFLLAAPVAVADDLGGPDEDGHSQLEYLPGSAGVQFGEPGNKTRIEVKRTDEGADIVFTNTLTVWFGDKVDFTFKLDGWDVMVVYDPRSHRKPDYATVKAPPGWMAIPSEIEIKEDSVGVIRLMPIATG